MNQSRMCKTRNTVQRALILETVRDLKSHVSADEVHAIVSRTHPTISRGTVYRNLSKLAQEGVIAKHSMPNGPDRFDYNVGNHYHAVCENCGKIVDIEMSCLDGIENKVDNTHGYSLSGFDLVFKGLCPDCMAKGGKDNG